MAILDKNAYERKAEYAARKMNNNREIENDLTDAIFALGDLIEQWNTSIEKWLRAIDEQNGTEYCPSGASRIM